MATWRTNQLPTNCKKIALFLFFCFFIYFHIQNPPDFYTQLNSNLGAFNSQSGNNDDEMHSKQHNKDHSFVAIVTGSTVGVAVFILVIMIAVVVVAYKVRHRNSHPDSETLPLVDAKF